MLRISSVRDPLCALLCMSAPVALLDCVTAWVPALCSAGNLAGRDWALSVCNAVVSAKGNSAACSSGPGM